MVAVERLGDLRRYRFGLTRISERKGIIVRKAIFVYRSTVSWLRLSNKQNAVAADHHAMRSLTPTSLSIFPVTSSPSNRVVALAVDPESPASFFAALEQISSDGVQVDLIRLSDDDDERAPLASVDSPALAPFPLPEYRGQVVDLKYLADERTLVVLLAGGDIATVNLEGPDGGVAPVSHMLVVGGASACATCRRLTDVAGGDRRKRGQRDQGRGVVSRRRAVDPRHRYVQRSSGRWEPRLTL